MASNDYHFITRWRVQSTCREITEVLGDGIDLMRWWPSVYLEVKQLQKGDENEERQQPVKSALLHQPSKKSHGVPGTVAHREPERIPDVLTGIFRWLGNDAKPFIRSFGALA